MCRNHQEEHDSTQTLWLCIGVILACMIFSAGRYVERQVWDLTWRQRAVDMAKEKGWIK